MSDERELWLRLRANALEAARKATQSKGRNRAIPTPCGSDTHTHNRALRAVVIETWQASLVLHSFESSKEERTKEDPKNRFERCCIECPALGEVPASCNCFPSRARSLPVL